jgi:hypothetical protein
MAAVVSPDIDAFLAEQRNLIVAGTSPDGRPHLTPNWFYWDGERFYVSTMRGRVKYAIFRQDRRAQLAIDDPAGMRYAGALLIGATIENSQTHRSGTAPAIGERPQAVVQAGDLADHLWDMYTKRDRSEDVVAPALAVSAQVTSAEFE